VIEEKERSQAVDLTALEIDQLIGLFIGILSAKAWQYMGIRLTPGKSEAENDMGKASMAIDCVVFLTEKIAPNLSAEEARRLRDIVADLQINYVKRVRL
jgi:hypothetical protein